MKAAGMVVAIVLAYLATFAGHVAIQLKGCGFIMSSGAVAFVYGSSSDWEDLVAVPRPMAGSETLSSAPWAVARWPHKDYIPFSMNRILTIPLWPVLAVVMVASLKLRYAAPRRETWGRLRRIEDRGPRRLRPGSIQSQRGDDERRSPAR